MRKNLLLLLIIASIGTTAQAHAGFPEFTSVTTFTLSYVDGNGIDDKINVYPNPATDYFKIKNGENVHTVLIYNIVGRQMKRFKVDSQEDRFNIGELPKGMYVVRLMDDKNEVIQTIRMNKR